jgi:hypothetical protein
MSFGNTFVSGLLRSPLHRLLSGSTDLVRYTGRRSGREIVTPTQYARSGDDVVILVGRPDTKTWWRNFRTEGDLEVLLQGRWVPMTATAVVGADDPATVAPLLDAYLARFPRAAHTLIGRTGGTGDTGGTVDALVSQAVVVWCRPRPT